MHQQDKIYEAKWYAKLPEKGKYVDEKVKFANEFVCLYWWKQMEQGLEIIWFVVIFAPDLPSLGIGDAHSPLFY